MLITDIVKGNVNIGDTIQIKYPAKDTQSLNKNLDNLLDIGSDCLLFLNDYSKIDDNIPYSLVNPSQSIVEFNSKNNTNSSTFDYVDNTIDLFNNIPKGNLIDY